MADRRVRDEIEEGEEDGPPYLPPYEPHDELITYMEAGPRRDPSERRTFWQKLKWFFGA